MKKLIILLLTLALILGVFASCNSKRYLPIDDETSSSPSENTSTEDNQGGITTDGLTEDTLPDFEDETTKPGEVKYVTSYEVKKVGDQWYMIFDSYVSNPDIPNNFYTDMHFQTLGELKNKILNHSLTLPEMQNIVDNFTRDDIGIPIFNLEDPYVSNLGPSVVVEDGEPHILSLAWSDGECYDSRHYLSTDDDENDYEVFTTFFMYSKAEFEQEYNKAVNNYSEPRTIQNENKTAHIVMSSHIICMYVTEGEYYYSYVISDYEEFPDDETLLSYGIEKYE